MSIVSLQVDLQTDCFSELSQHLTRVLTSTMLHVKFEQCLSMNPTGHQCQLLGYYLSENKITSFNAMFQLSLVVITSLNLFTFCWSPAVFHFVGSSVVSTTNDISDNKLHFLQYIFRKINTHLSLMLIGQLVLILESFI